MNLGEKKDFVESLRGIRRSHRRILDTLTQNQTVAYNELAQLIDKANNTDDDKIAYDVINMKNLHKRSTDEFIKKQNLVTEYLSETIDQLETSQ